MEKYGKIQAAFQRKIIIIFLLSQIPIIISLFVLQEIYNLPKILFISLFCYLLFGFIYWHYHAIPEIKIHPKIMKFVVLPYFLWQLTSIFSFIPLLLTIPALFFYNFLLFSYIVILVIVSSLIISIFGYLSSLRIKIKKMIVPSDLFQAEFINYKIAHLSDLHIGNITTREKLCKWIEQLNNLKPDIVCITGDFITFGDAFIEDLKIVLNQFKSPDGIVCCLGNHDYFSSNADELAHQLKNDNIIVLKNNTHSVFRKDKSINFIGIDGIVDNLDLQRKYLESTLQTIKELQPHVLLVHDPLLFTVAKDNNIPLTLSGHTHGGQIAHPFNPRKNIAAKRYLYSTGKYQDQNCQLYVNQGLGVALLPFRLFTYPELVIFEIK